jgi:hypothetical protein
MRTKEKKELLPLSRSLLTIFLSTVLISGSATLFWLYTLHAQHSRAHNEAFIMKEIMQTGPSAGFLPSDYLMRLLRLSPKQPVNLYRFDLNRAKKRLLTSPFIQDVTLTRVHPHTLKMNYKFRAPFVQLTGGSKEAILDKEGILLPPLAFIDTKKLPELDLGKDSETKKIAWGKPLANQKFALASQLFEKISKDPTLQGLQILRLDLSQADAECCGTRQIVLTLKKGEETHVLRLDPEQLDLGFKEYALLQTAKVEWTPEEQELPLLTIDLRVPSVAYLKRLK